METEASTAAIKPEADGREVKEKSSKHDRGMYLSPPIYPTIHIIHTHLQLLLCKLSCLSFLSWYFEDYYELIWIVSLKIFKSIHGFKMETNLWYVSFKVL